MKNISIIVVIDKHSAIGKGNDLLCHLPADLKHFKNTTTGHTVIMGRKTYDSLPKGALPNRRNIVITRNPEFTAERVEVAHSFEQAVEMVQGEEEVFVMGGAQIYNIALPFATNLYLTEIDHQFDDADTFFPEIDYSQWTEESREPHDKDEKNPYPYSFVKLVRK